MMKLLRLRHIGVHCKDTTGAGDLYASGFLFGYANNLDMEKCGLAGSVLAGHVIEILGARMDQKKWDSIKNHLIIHRILS